MSRFGSQARLERLRKLKAFSPHHGAKRREGSGVGVGIMGAAASRRPSRPGMRSLVLAVDDSPEAAVAFSWVRANVLRQSDSLELVHVHDPGVSQQEARGKVAKIEELCGAHGIHHRLVLAPGARGKTAGVLAATAAHAYMIVVGCRTLGAVERAFIGSVSSKLAATSACPVMVIKKPPREAGVFLTVIPRRVCLHIDGTPHAHAAFLWALAHLLAPEDDVYLLCCARKKGKVASWLTGDLMSVCETELGKSAQDCEELCIKAGFNVTIVFVSDLPASTSTGQLSSPSAAYKRWSSSSTSELIRHATQASCNLLVVSRESDGCKIARQSPFPVVVVGAPKGEGAGDVSVAHSVSSHSSGRASGPDTEAFDIGENSDDEEAAEVDSEADREAERERESLRQRQIRQEHVYDMYKEKQAKGSLKLHPVSVSG